MRASLATTIATLLALGLAPGVRADDFPKRYAIVVAVDEYASSGVPKLQFAERDAEKLALRLEAQGYYVTAVVGNKARRGEIIRELLLAQERLQPEDSFVLFFAGHGVRKQSNGQVYWLNYDGDPQRPDIDGLRLRHLIELVREIPATRKLVLLDHCYAGDVQEATPGIGDGRDTPMTPLPLVVGREAFPEGFDRDIVAANSGGSPDRSMFVVAASRGVAFEDPALMHGFFTQVLLSALREPQADIQQVDGAVSMGELMDFVETQVVQLSSSRQKPYVLPAEGNLMAGLRWQPFIRSLTAAEVGDRRQRYADKLRQWTNQQLMTPEIQTLGDQVLERWQASPNALSPSEERVVATLRLLIDTPPVIEPARVAAEVSRIVQFELGQ